MLLTYEEGFKGERVYIRLANILVVVYSLVLFFRKEKYGIQDKTLVFKLFVLLVLLMYLIQGVLGWFTGTSYAIMTSSILKISYVTLLIGLYRVFKASYVEFLTEVFIIFGVLAGFLAMISTFIGTLEFGIIRIEGGYDKLLRLYGWFGSPNRLGSMLGVALLALTHKLLGKSKFTLWNLFGSFVLVSSLLLTGSRGSIISFIISFLVYLFLGKRISPLRTLWRGLFLLFVSLCMFQILRIIFDFSLESFLDNTIRINQTEFARAEINANTLKLIRELQVEELLFGSGENFSLNSVGKSTHNGLFATLIDNGLFYLVGMLWIICLALRKLRWKSIVSEEGDSYLFMISILIFIVLRELTNNQGMLSSGLYNFMFYSVLIETFIKRNENPLFT